VFTKCLLAASERQDYYYPAACSTFVSRRCGCWRLADFFGIFVSG